MIVALHVYRVADTDPTAVETLRRTKKTTIAVVPPARIRGSIEVFVACARFFLNMPMGKTKVDVRALRFSLLEHRSNWIERRAGKGDPIVRASCRRQAVRETV